MIKHIVGEEYASSTDDERRAEQNTEEIGETFAFFFEQNNVGNIIKKSWRAIKIISNARAI